MYEPRMTPVEKLLRDLAWAFSPQRCKVQTLCERFRRALAWFVLGVLCAAAAWLVYAHHYPAEVVAAEARLEDQSERFLVYSIGTVRRGVEVRCLLTVYREQEGFTVSC